MKAKLIRAYKNDSGPSLPRSASGIFFKTSFEEIKAK